jgi:hypothetical protein
MSKYVPPALRYKEQSSGSSNTSTNIRQSTNSSTSTNIRQSTNSSTSTSYVPPALRKKVFEVKEQDFPTIGDVVAPKSPPKQQVKFDYKSALDRKDIPPPSPKKSVVSSEKKDHNNNTDNNKVNVEYKRIGVYIEDSDDDNDNDYYYDDNDNDNDNDLQPISPKTYQPQWISFPFNEIRKNRVFPERTYDKNGWMTNDDYVEWYIHQNPNLIGWI